MKRKRIVSIVLMAFIFLSVNIIGPDMTRLLRGEKSYTEALAAPRSSSGGFKSGSFKSSGGFKTGGFKSGSFFNTKGNSSWSMGSSWPRSSGRSWFRMPWSFGRSYGFNPFYLMFGSFGSIIRLIIIAAVIYYIVRIMRRR